MNYIFEFGAYLVKWIHLAIVLTFIISPYAILYGLYKKRPWARNFKLRILHIIFICFITVNVILHVPCPLTMAEKQLLIAGTGQSYKGGFIESRLVEMNVGNPRFIIRIILFPSLALSILLFVFFPPQRQKNTSGQ